jgi:hypothetical protein
MVDCIVPFRLLAFHFHLRTRTSAHALRTSKPLVCLHREMRRSGSASTQRRVWCLVTGLCAATSLVSQPLVVGAAQSSGRADDSLRALLQVREKGVARVDDADELGANPPWCRGSGFGGFKSAKQVLDQRCGCERGPAPPVKDGACCPVVAYVNGANCYGHGTCVAFQPNAQQADFLKQKDNKYIGQFLEIQEYEFPADVVAGVHDAADGARRWEAGADAEGETEGNRLTMGLRLRGQVGGPAGGHDKDNAKQQQQATAAVGDDYDEDDQDDQDTAERVDDRDMRSAPFGVRTAVARHAPLLRTGDVGDRSLHHAVSSLGLGRIGVDAAAAGRAHGGGVVTAGATELSGAVAPVDSFAVDNRVLLPKEQHHGDYQSAYTGHTVHGRRRMPMGMLPADEHQQLHLGLPTAKQRRSTIRTSTAAPPGLAPPTGPAEVSPRPPTAAPPPPPASAFAGLGIVATVATDSTSATSLAGSPPLHPPPPPPSSPPPQKSDDSGTTPREIPGFMDRVFAALHLSAVTSAVLRRHMNHSEASVICARPGSPLFTDVSQNGSVDDVLLEHYGRANCAGVQDTSSTASALLHTLLNWSSSSPSSKPPGRLRPADASIASSSSMAEDDDPTGGDYLESVHIAASALVELSSYALSRINGAYGQIRWSPCAKRKTEDRERGARREGETESVSVRVCAAVDVRMQHDGCARTVKTRPWVVLDGCTV